MLPGKPQWMWIAFGGAVGPQSEAEEGETPVADFWGSAGVNGGMSMHGFALIPSGGSAPVAVSAGALTALHTVGAIDVAYPAGLSANDIVLLITNSQQDNPVTSAPGFTQIGTQQLINDGVPLAILARGGVWWMRAAGTESGTVSVQRGSNGSSGDIFYGVMIAYSGCITSGDPYEGLEENVQNGGTNPAVANAVTTLGPNRTVLCVMNQVDNSLRGGASAGPATGWANRVTERDNVGNDGAIYVDDIAL